MKYFLLVLLVAQGLFAAPQDCMFLSGIYRLPENKSQSLEIIFNTSSGVLGFTYRDAGRVSRVYQYSVDEQQHDGDGWQTGNKYVAQCLKPEFSTQEIFDLHGPLNRKFILEGSTLRELSTKDGNQWYTNSIYEKL